MRRTLLKTVGIMGRIRQEAYILIWIGIGIVLSTAAANKIFAARLADYQLLYKNLCRGWERLASGETPAVIKTVGARLLQSAGIAAVCRREGHLRDAGIPGVLLFAGITFGYLLVLFTWCRGIFGILLFLAAGFPHMLCYGAAWGILILRGLSGYEIRRFRFWGAVGGLTAAGIFLEIYVHPVVLYFV